MRSVTSEAFGQEHTKYHSVSRKSHMDTREVESTTPLEETSSYRPEL
jgi:hypothetical protein